MDKIEFIARNIYKQYIEDNDFKNICFDDLCEKEKDKVFCYANAIILSVEKNGYFVLSKDEILEKTKDGKTYVEILYSFSEDEILIMSDVIFQIKKELSIKHKEHAPKHKEEIKLKPEEIPYIIDKIDFYVCKIFSVN